VSTQDDAVAAAAEAGEGGWPVPVMELPVGLADPARSDELVASLEAGGDRIA
jgi:hypothetical protein